MQRFRHKIWTHQSNETGERYPARSIPSSEPRTITSFRDLVKATAEISFRNPDQVLFFRGQCTNFVSFIEGTRVSNFFPSLYRSPGKTLTKEQISTRFSHLDDCGKELLATLKAKNIPGHQKLAKFPELLWAILQHYEVCQTPLLDVTHSLRVAASFALNDADDEGYVFAFGFPHPNGSITYSVELELINIRLLSICPPDAQRPYFQEGFLVGTFPILRLRRHPSLDVGVRLIAKFRLIKSAFWSDRFHAIPKNALLPSRDVMEEICSTVRDRIHLT